MAGAGRRERLWIDPGKCLACDSCAAACRARHGAARLRRLPPDPRPSIPAVCRRCADPAPCVEHCIAGVLARDPETGEVRQDPDRCVGCGSCIMACPYAAVFIRKGRGRTTCVRCDRCRGFGALACVFSCPTGAFHAGDDATFEAFIRRPHRPLAATAAAACLLVPAAGFFAGRAGAAAAAPALNHLLGVLGGVLMTLAFFFPLAGRFLWEAIPRAVWTRLHLFTGSAAAAFALAHTANRFSANIQTAAAVLTALLVVTGVAWRYARPPGLRLRPGSAVPRSVFGRLAAGVLPLRAAHVGLAILAVGLIAAHVVVMLAYGTSGP